MIVPDSALVFVPGLVSVPVSFPVWAMSRFNPGHQKPGFWVPLSAQASVPARVLSQVF